VTRTQSHSVASEIDVSIKYMSAGEEEEEESPSDKRSKEISWDFALGLACIIISECT